MIYIETYQSYTDPCLTRTSSKGTPVDLSVYISIEVPLGSHIIHNLQLAGSPQGI